MTSRLKDIADELRSIAQNDYMIDSHYLSVGTDLTVVADTLERISDAESGSDFAKEAK
jgi:hypothetical protein